MAIRPARRAVLNSLTLGLLYDTLIGCHKEEFVLIFTDSRLNGNNRGDFLIFHKGQEVPDKGALGLTAASGIS